MTRTKSLNFTKEPLMPFLKGIVILMALIVPSSINVSAYTRAEVMDKLSSIGCANVYSDVEIDSLSNMSNRKFDLWLPYADSKASGDLSPISMYMLNEYNNGLKKTFKKDFNLMNNALFNHKCEEEKFMLMVDFFTPLLWYLNINPDKFVKSVKSYPSFWITGYRPKPINVANNPSFVQAFGLKYSKKHPEANVPTINQALMDVAEIINNNFPEEKLMYDIEIKKKDGVIELTKSHPDYTFDRFYFRGDTLALKEFKTPEIKLKRKHLDEHSRDQDFYSIEETFTSPEYKRNALIKIDGAQKTIVIKIKLNPQDVYNYKSRLLWNEYAKLNKIVENSPTLSIWFDINHINYKPTIKADVLEVKREDFLNNANIYAIIDDGKVVQKAYLDGDCVTFPLMEECIKSLSEKKAQRFKEEDEELAAQIAKDKADQLAREKYLIKRCRESNYMDLNIYNIEWLEENGYLTVDGYDLIAFAGGGGYVTVVNKKGVRRSLRISEYGNVIGQR